MDRTALGTSRAERHRIADPAGRPARRPGSGETPRPSSIFVFLVLAGLIAGVARYLAATEGDDAMKEAKVEEHHPRKPLPSAEEIEALPKDGGPEFNRLVFESSPYLLQHARNPVDWYPWGEEAFARARREDKPLFLSIGYSTCHWCHVMERESFEDERVAGILNEHYVAIKVDREERPDIDNIYMAAVQAVTGSGGWPMSVFLTADARPFLVGTYFPPEDRFGRPGFPTILLGVAEAWKEKRDQLLEGASRITSHLQGLTARGEQVELGEATLRRGFESYAGQFDPAHGGFGHAPKFPRPHSLSFLLRYSTRSEAERARGMVEATLRAMARGGIRDHLAGGFHRYSTDPVWLVPHFEKMLYDQALLARAYLEAYQVSGSEEHALLAREILDYVLRDLADPAGGFHSAEDADSEGVEGKFYVWRRREILDLLGEEDGKIFCQVYGATEEGNYREEATGVSTGASILHLRRPLGEAAGELELDVSELERRLAAMRVRLLEVRERRVRPQKDDKVLADWNGLMVSTLAQCGRVLGEPRYLEAAERAAAFVTTSMEREGRLLHVYRAGKASVPAYLDDYAFVALGLLDLYEATFDVRWLEESGRLARELLRLFWDEEGKGFLFSGRDAEDLIAETKEVYDGSVPSGNSAAALLLLRLGRMTVDEELESRGRDTLSCFSRDLDRMPMGFPFLLMALDFAVGPTREIVLAGTPGDSGVAALHRAVAGRFLPRKVLLFHPQGDAGKRVRELVPFIEGQVAVGGKATAYVCESYACQLPVTEVEKLVGLLEAEAPTEP